MIKRQFHLDESRITLPKGTRVVLKTDLRADDAYLCKSGTIGVVVEQSYENVILRTPAGRRIACQRDQVVIQKQDVAASIARRQFDWAELKERVIYSAVVGSTAWGLADAQSDEDQKGVFVLPFEGAAGLWEPVDEIQDPQSDTQYWEVQKLIYQGLLDDANTLEMLWSPHVRVCTELGHALHDVRQAFVSQNIFGTFGRYAMSQFRKMRAAQKRRAVQQAIAEMLQKDRDLGEAQVVERLAEGVISGEGREKRAQEAIRQLYRSLFDRGLLETRGYPELVEFLVAADISEILGDAPRWKNAYNLLRLLYSGIRWLREGQPLIEVQGEMREELMAVKRGDVPLSEILARADVLAEDLEQAFSVTALPERPDFDGAHDFLLRCRKEAASQALSRDRLGRVSASAVAPRAVAGEARFDIPRANLSAYLERHAERDFIVCSLVGSHSYGFPSRDSDFDLKAIHLAPSADLLGLDAPKETIQFLGDVDGLEIDFTSHEARPALERMLRGDGNVLERIFSPYVIAPAPVDARLDELRVLARKNLNKRFFRHYQGFYRGMLKNYDKEPQKKIKPLLYMFRVMLCGVHLLREAEVLADLKALLAIYPFPRIDELFAKKEVAELATIDDDRPYLELLPELEALLADALAQSPLPDEAPHREELSRWLAAQRAALR